MYIIEQKTKSVKWSDEEIQILKDNYSLLGARKIIEKFNFNRSIQSIINKAFKLKLKSLNKEENCRIYDLNVNFFSKINILNSFYAGFITTDGNIFKNRLCIEIQSKDISILESFKKDLLSKHPIKTRNGNNTCIFNQYVSLNIKSKTMVKDLATNFLIFPNKTGFQKFPKLNFKETLSFLIGCICGDGTIFLREKTNKNGTKRKDLSISLVCKNIDFLEYVKNIINIIIPENSKNKSIYECDGVYKWEINNKKALKFAKYCLNIIKKYKLPVLDRKWKKITEYENYIRTRENQT